MDLEGVWSAQMARNELFSSTEEEFASIRDATEMRERRPTVIQKQVKLTEPDHLPEGLISC